MTCVLSTVYCVFVECVSESLTMGRCLKQPDVVRAQILKSVFTWEPPLFSCPACRVNCNSSSSSCVSCQNTSHSCMHSHMKAECAPHPPPFNRKNTNHTGHCGWVTVQSPYPNYGRPLITRGVIKNQAAVATNKQPERIKEHPQMLPLEVRWLITAHHGSRALHQNMTTHPQSLR